MKVKVVTKVKDKTETDIIEIEREVGQNAYELLNDSYPIFEREIFKKYGRRQVRIIETKIEEM
jgi:capsular polysaccharide biosynthesis protein